jgi:hypothetical protein
MQRPATRFFPIHHRIRKAFSDGGFVIMIDGSQVPVASRKGKTAGIV